MLKADLPAGHPARLRAGLLVISSLTLAAGFAVLTILSKEAPALDLRQPWQDDPYDVLVSLDFAVLPLLVTIGMLRVQLCRRHEPLPVRRLVDLQRIAQAALAITFVTELAEWVAVTLQRHRSTWNAATAWQVAALAAFTVATVCLWLVGRSAAQAVMKVAAPAAQPDWLADAVAVGLFTIHALPGRFNWVETALGWSEKNAITRIRQHPIAAAALLAVILGLPFVGAKIVLEQYPAPLVLLVAVFVSGSFFVLVVAAGAYLRVIAPRAARPPTALITVLVGLTAGAVAFAFHDSLLQHQTTAGLSALYFGAGITAAVASLALSPLWRRRADSQ